MTQQPDGSYLEQDDHVLQEYGRTRQFKIGQNTEWEAVEDAPWLAAVRAVEFCDE
jgi:hypothetical protein